MMQKLRVPDGTIPTMDQIWQAIRSEAQAEVGREAILAGFLHATILKHRTLEESLSLHLAGKLATESLPSMLVRELIDEMLESRPQIGDAVRADLQAVFDRDPASYGYMTPFLYSKRFHALQGYTADLGFWQKACRVLAVHLTDGVCQ